MYARELFREIVAPNYYEFCGNPTDIRLLWNALISMNSVADYLALERLNYLPASSQELQVRRMGYVNNMILKTSLFVQTH